MRILAVVALALVTGCVKVSADVPQICASQSVKIGPSQTPTTAATSATIQQELDLGSIGNIDFLSRLTLGGGSVTPEQGDLSFIDAMTVTLEAQDGTSQPLVLVSYHRDNAAAPSEIAIAETDRDLMPYVNGSTGTKLLVSVTGKPPQNGATLAVELCLNAGVDTTVELTK